MRILALVTARGGSKRLPGKNLRPLGGEPLIVWSIGVVQGMSDICDVLVSTDDADIAAIARSSGALVPWLRPAELATDTASSLDVCLHALTWYESERGKIDGLLLLQPTSPFRRRDSIRRGIELFRMNQHRSVVGVSPAESHPQWCFRLDGTKMRPFIDGGGLSVRSQDLPPAYVINGAFYLVATRQLLTRKSLFSDDMLPLVMDAMEERIDIDTEWDWEMAETVVRLRNQANT